MNPKYRDPYFLASKYPSFEEWERNGCPKRSREEEEEEEEEERLRRSAQRRLERMHE